MNSWKNDGVQWNIFESVYVDFSRSRNLNLFFLTESV